MPKKLSGFHLRRGANKVAVSRKPVGSTLTSRPARRAPRVPIQQRRERLETHCEKGGCDPLWQHTGDMNVLDESGNLLRVPTFRDRNDSGACSRDGSGCKLNPCVAKDASAITSQLRRLDRQQERMRTHPEEFASRGAEGVSMGGAPRRRRTVGSSSSSGSGARVERYRLKEDDPTMMYNPLVPGELRVCSAAEFQTKDACDASSPPCKWRKSQALLNKYDGDAQLGGYCQMDWGVGAVAKAKEDAWRATAAKYPDVVKTVPSKYFNLDEFVPAKAKTSRTRFTFPEQYDGVCAKLPEEDCKVGAKYGICNWSDKRGGICSLRSGKNAASVVDDSGYPKDAEAAAWLRKRQQQLRAMGFSVVGAAEMAAEELEAKMEAEATGAATGSTSDSEGEMEIEEEEEAEIGGKDVFKGAELGTEPRTISRRIPFTAGAGGMVGYGGCSASARYGGCSASARYGGCGR